MNSIECPYCGKSDAVSNTLDLGEGEHKVECIACQKEFLATGEVYLKFHSKKTSCREGKHEFTEWTRYDFESDWYIRMNIMPNICEPHSIWSRRCVDCDEIEASEELPFGSALPEHLKEV